MSRYFFVIFIFLFFVSTVVVCNSNKRYQLISASFHSLQPPSFVSSQYRAFVRLYSYVFSSNSKYHFLGHTLTDELSVKIPPLNYPNPFSFREGTTLYYSLSKSATLDLYVFNLMGQQLVKKTFMKEMNGGRRGMNTILINDAFFEGYSLAPSVYIYILVDASNPEFVLGKGKLAVIP